MNENIERFTLPRGKLAAWLLDAGSNVPYDIRVALAGSLFGTLPIFFGGVLNTVAVAWVLERRHPSAPFKLWLAVEIIVCVVRFFVLVIARRRARAGRSTLTDTYVLLATAWGATVGYGALVSVMSGDWVATTLSFLSAAAMVGGICFRNFGAPRLVAVMIFLSLGPCCLGAFVTDEPVMLITLVQIPFYLFAMSAAAWRLNGLLVSTMKAERANDHRARHDELTGLLNRSGLFHAARQGQYGFDGIGVGTALFFLDLDGFKPVNDAYGHEAGDRLLARVANRLRELAGPTALVARLGGDEFTVLRCDVDGEHLGPYASHLIQQLSEPFDLGLDAAVRVGISVGIAVASSADSDIDSLLRKADEAMYAAKRQGKGRFAVNPGDGAARAAATDEANAATV